MKSSRFGIALVGMGILLTASITDAQDESAAAEIRQTPGFGGPDAVENTIAADIESWDDWQTHLKEKYRLTLAADYTGVLLTASETLDSNTAAGGIARVYGTLDILKEGDGAIVWKFEHRHGYGDPSPFAFSLGSLGYVGLQEPPFNDTGFRTQNLYWRQRFGGGRSTLIAGVLDPTDYVDAFALASPWLHFMNFAFSTGSATIGLPNDGAVGAALGSMVTDNIYVIAGITDTNGDPSDPFSGFGNFFSDNEYFTSVEVGYTTSHQRIIFDNAHVTVWHKDRQVEANINSGWGAAFSFSRYINDNLMPFLRGGYADDGGSLLQKSLSVGMGYQTEAFNGLMGAGFNWGEPNEDTFGPGLSDQYALEFFYRIPIGRRVAVTGDVQYIKHPALNPDANTIWMFNLRARAAF
jgi:porin